MPKKIPEPFRDTLPPAIADFPPDVQKLAQRIAKLQRQKGLKGPGNMWTRFGKLVDKTIERRCLMQCRKALTPSEKAVTYWIRSRGGLD